MTAYDDAKARLASFYNGDPFDAGTNPGGMASGGHRTNFEPALQDIATVGDGIAVIAGEAEDSAEAAALSVIAAEAIRAATDSLREDAANSSASALSNKNATDANLASTVSSAALAAASAGVAGSGPATTLLYPALSKLLATATDVADVIVYDTRLDSDGGAWRFRCEHLPWYQEPLNVTGVTGAKQVPPAVMAMVLRATSGGTATALTIYDLTDLDGTGVPRLWKSFTGNGFGTAVTTAVPASVSAVNGRVYVSLSGTSGRLCVLDFPAGAYTIYTNAPGTNRRANSWTAGNWSVGTPIDASVPDLVNRDVKHVHARVLPGAQLDAAGLPIPTILVSTAAGASVIHPNGVVYDITRAGGYAKGLILPDGRLWLGTAASALTEFGPMPYADIANTSWRQGFYSSVNNGSPALFTGPNNGVEVRAIAAGAIGISGNLALVAEDADNPANGMAAFVANNYATGWMPSNNIRLASLCDGTTGNITGSAELVANGTFDTDLSGWTVTVTGSSTVTQGSGAASLTTDGTNPAEFDQTITTVVGQTYLIAVPITAHSGGALTLRVGNSRGSSALGSTAATAVGTMLMQFTATATTTWFGLFKSATAGTSTIDNVSGKLAVADRSPKAKGLIVNGTLSRTAVAAGADMVAFSGFSASNYLEQPYSADQDYGTADFFAMAWHKSTDPTAAGELIARASAGYTGPRFRLSQSATGFVASVHDGTTAAVATGTSTSAGTGIWQHVAMVKRGTVLELWVNGVKEATTSVASVGTLTNATATLRMGLKQDGAALNLGSLALARLGAYAPSPAQMARIVRDEAPLFEANAKAFLGGTSNAVAALSRDETRNVLGVATADGVSEFSGPRRTAYFDTASVPGSVLTNDNMKALGMGGGFTVMAGGAQAIAYRPARNGVDEMNLYAKPPPREKLVPRGVTTDATPLNLSPRIPVGEREFVFVDAVVVAKQEGVAATEAAVYPIRAAFKRDAGGNITLITVAAEQKWAGWNTVGPAAMTSQYETTSTMEAVFVVDTASQTIAIQATGKAATRLIWEVNILPSSYRVSQETQYLPIAA